MDPGWDDLIAAVISELCVVDGDKAPERFDHQRTMDGVVYSCALPPNFLRHDSYPRPAGGSGQQYVRRESLRPAFRSRHIGRPDSPMMGLKELICTRSEVKNATSALDV